MDALRSSILLELQGETRVSVTMGNDAGLVMFNNRPCMDQINVVAYLAINGILPEHGSIQATIKNDNGILQCWGNNPVGR